MARSLTASTPAIAEAGARPGVGASRRSRLSRGTQLVHADLHNHSLLSDGDGDPALAFDSMRNAGLDVAALTDHATYSDNLLGDVLAGMLPPEYQQAAGLTPEGWARTAAHADDADADKDGAFTAIRGFAFPGVPLRRAGTRPGGLARDVQPSGRLTLRGLVRRQILAPVACLNAGWRTGITGVTDEHGIDWGHPEGKGRTGLWVEQHSRRGMKAAMRPRRFFATRTSGLRIDATATVQFRVGELVELRVPVDIADGDWLLLRIADPAQPNATPGPDGHPGNQHGIAYTSPWWPEPVTA